MPAKGRTIELPGRGKRAEEVYEYLHEAILDGTLEPNERLFEEEIGNSAGVSRTPVREALHRLQMDGLVRQLGRGVVVVDFSKEEMADLCEVREGLEGFAARLAANARSELDVVTLRELVQAMEQAVESKDVPRLVALNHAFHETIWSAARNRYLAGQLRLLRGLIERRQPTTLSLPERQRQMLTEHAEILAAVDRRDAESAEAATLRHFRAAMAIRLAGDYAR
jgi:DNA-binding GntR family transcriptional regulator